MKNTKKYNVRIKHKDGTFSCLSHRDRIEWTYRTAKKHSSDIQRMILSGERDYQFSVVTLA
jgi:hypothetical protein